MEVYFAVVVFLFGLLFGSFYNVVGYRIPNNMSIVWPHSFCPKCKHELKWYELIPVLSFLIQKGKCRKCKCSISFFYPIIELLTGVLFMLSYLKFGFTPEFAISILVSSFLVIVIVSDFNYLVISDEVTIFFSIISVLVQFIFLGVTYGISSIVYGISSFITMYIIMILGSKIMGEEALGGGDVKLMFFVGTVLSAVSPVVLSDLTTYSTFFNIFFEIFLASATAIPFAIFSFCSKKNRVVPFGPFILLASLIIFLSQYSIVDYLFKI